MRSYAKTHAKILNATKYAGNVFLAIGIITLFYGSFVSDYGYIGIGMGSVIGAIFIFLMGVFFVATEEMLENTNKGINITLTKPRKIYKCHK